MCVRNGDTDRDSPIYVLDNSSLPPTFVTSYRPILGGISNGQPKYCKLDYYAVVDTTGPHPGPEKGRKGV